MPADVRGAGHEHYIVSRRMAGAVSGAGAAATECRMRTVRGIEDRNTQQSGLETAFTQNVLHK